MGRHGSGGFTLVEMVLLVGLILLFSTTAGLSIPPMLDSFRMKEATTLLVGAVREAQMRALREGRPWRVVIDSDGGGYALEYASNATADPWECEETAGWSPSTPTRFHETLSIEVSSFSRKCVAFSSSGRGDWPNPEVLIGETEGPIYGAETLLRLTDRVELDPANLPTDPRMDSRITLWYNKNPAIYVDLGEVRYFSTVCVGLYSRPSTYRYPLSVNLAASTSADFGSAVWTEIYAGPGPTDPSSGVTARTCFPLTVNGAYRYFRLNLTRNGSWVSLDEFKAGDLRFVLKGPRQAKQLLIKPVTGRVTLENA